MTGQRRHLFSLHELLIMAALAALGGVSGSAVSIIRATLHAVFVLPGGMQYLAGIHVLWLVLAVGLVRKPGAATVTSLLKGTVELLSGNPLGLLVLLYCCLAGLAVDATWLLMGRGDHRTTYVLAGGAGAASNVLVLALIVSLPGRPGIVAGLGLFACVAFISGSLLAGVLGYWLLGMLRKAGVTGAQFSRPLGGQPRSWIRLGAWGVLLVIIVLATFLATRGGDSEPASTSRASLPALGDSTSP